MVGCLCSEFGLFHRLSFRFLPQNRQRSGYNSKCLGSELTSNAVLADFFFRANTSPTTPSLYDCKRNINWWNLVLYYMLFVLKQFTMFWFELFKIDDYY